jgi:hypothetical protein
MSNTSILRCTKKKILLVKEFQVLSITFGLLLNNPQMWMLDSYPCKYKFWKNMITSIQLCKSMLTIVMKGNINLKKKICIKSSTCYMFYSKT